MGNSVDTKCAAHIMDDDRHELAAALRGGVSVMRKLALEFKYMTPNPGELKALDDLDGGPGRTVYQQRVGRSVLKNTWASTIRDLSRQSFREPMTLNGWDEEIAGVTTTDKLGALKDRKPGWVDNIDAAGQSIQHWAQGVFEQCMFDGIAFAVVDYDSRSFATAQDRIAAGARPFVTMFTRAQVPNIVLGQSSDGASVRPLMVVIYQPIKTRDISDPLNWSEEETPAYKVYLAGDPEAPPGAEERLVRTRTYVQRESESKKGGKEFAEDTSRRRFIRPVVGELFEIPIVPFYGQRTAPFRGDSPFLDTAHIEVAAWQHGSEEQELARTASLVFVHESGVNPQLNTSTTSPPGGKAVRSDLPQGRYRFSTDPHAKLTVVEQEGKAMAAIGRLVSGFEDTIRQAHHRLAAEKPTVAVTAREISFHGMQANSQLEMWIGMHEASWNKVLELMACLAGLSKLGMVSIPRKMGLPSVAMDRLTQVYLAGKMSSKNYFRQASLAGDLDVQTFDFAAEVDREAREAQDEARSRDLGGLFGGGTNPANPRFEDGDPSADSGASDRAEGGERE